MSAEICRTLALAFLIVFFDCLVLSLFFCVLGALFMEMNNSEMEKLMEKCTIVVIVVLALSLVFALDFGVFHLILK